VSKILYYTKLFRILQPSFWNNAEFTSWPNDNYFPKQWNLLNVAQGIPYGDNQVTYCTAGMDINICGAWNITKGDSNIKVAVIDNGVAAHVDINSNLLLEGYDAKTGTVGSKLYNWGAVMVHLVQE